MEDDIQRAGAERVPGQVGACLRLAGHGMLQTPGVLMKHRVLLCRAQERGPGGAVDDGRRARAERVSGQVGAGVGRGHGRAG